MVSNLLLLRIPLENSQKGQFEAYLSSKLEVVMQRQLCLDVGKGMELYEKLLSTDKRFY